MHPALAGVRVLDLSRVLAGPWASQTLADLGADVIKIERPGTGDDTRHWGPPFVRDEAGNETAESAYFLAANRGKKSVTIDFAHPEGRKILAALAAQSDVVIENFKVGHLARYGLDATTLRAQNDRLIYCSISGFGQTGPHRDRPGYDFMIQGLGGLMSLTGHADARPGGGPMKTGIAIGDLFAGLYAAIGILAALRRRDATGSGETIDISLLDCQIAMLANQASAYLTSGVVPARCGNAHSSIVPYESFETADTPIIVAVGNDAQFAALSRVLDRPEWPGDVRFSTNPARVAHRETLVPLIASALRARPSADWLAALECASVPAGPINTLDMVFADPQVQARGIVQRLPHAAVGDVPTIASPIRLMDAPQPSPMGPPTLGQHTDEVLEGRLDLSAAEIAILRNRGAI